MPSRRRRGARTPTTSTTSADQHPQRDAALGQHASTPASRSTSARRRWPRWRGSSAVRSTAPDRALARPRLGRGVAARDVVGLRDARGRRRLLGADRDPEGRARERRGGRPTPVGARSSASGSSRRGSRGRSRRSSRTTSRAARATRTRISAVPRRARPAPPRTTPTRGSAGYLPNLQATVWVGYPRGPDPDGERPRHPRRRAAPSRRRSGASSCGRSPTGSPSAEWSPPNESPVWDVPPPAVRARPGADAPVPTDEPEDCHHRDGGRRRRNRSPSRSRVEPRGRPAEEPPAEEPPAEPPPPGDRLTSRLDARRSRPASPSSPSSPRSARSRGRRTTRPSRPDRPLVPVPGRRLGRRLRPARGRGRAGLRRRASSSSGVHRRRAGPPRCSRVAIQLTPLAAPLLLSSDAWTYWMYGRIAAVPRREPVRRAAGAFPEDPGVPVDRARLARPDLASTARRSRSRPSPSRWQPESPRMPPRGCSRRWPPRRCSTAALLAARLADAQGARARAGRLEPGARPPRRGRRPQRRLARCARPRQRSRCAASERRRLAGAAWALAVLVKWVPLVFLVLRALEARGSGRRVSHLGFAAVARARSPVWRRSGGAGAGSARSGR